MTMFKFDPTYSAAVREAADAELVPEPVVPGPLTDGELDAMDRYWRAANYLTAGQIYLRANPLLRAPLAAEHIKPRLLGHWGTSPGLSFIYTHVNRLIRRWDQDAIYLAGPGHGGPALVANVYLEGTYTEVYPAITRDTAGIERLFRQFSTPGGIPSHVSAPTPGSIHEGGELGYVLTHAFGAGMDNPRLLAIAVVGDGEFETAPLAGSWKSIDFLNPAPDGNGDGAVLPILHLNGFKIANPTTPARTPDARLFQYFAGLGYQPHLVAGSHPAAMHQAFAAVLDLCYEQIQQVRRGEHRKWPMIILRSPKGWTGPKELHGLPLEGSFRAHQVPLAAVREDPKQLAMLEAWLRSYRPEELFDRNGAPQPDLLDWLPRGERRMGANPHANAGCPVSAAGGATCAAHELQLPDWRAHAVAVPKPAQQQLESTRRLGLWLRDLIASDHDHRFRLFCPDELASNRLQDVLEVTSRRFALPILAGDDHLAPNGRVLEVLSENLCEGWLEGYLLTGRQGLFATYEAFAMVAASMIVQHSKWLEAARALPWRSPIANLNLLLTSTCWRQDHNGFSHQGPGLIDVVLSKRGTVARIYFPPDANCLLAVAHRAFETTNLVNLIVIDKQPQLQWLNPDEALEHCKRGASIWKWCSTPDASDVDVVLAACGDIPTLETVAAAWWLRRHAPELRLRVVNVVDLMSLFTPDVHPHGLTHPEFEALFTRSRNVVFAFHGYQRAVHEVIHGRANPDRFHVRGFREQGTTTTPFDMVVLNGMSRFDLASIALERALPDSPRKKQLLAAAAAEQAAAVAYSRDHFEDPPEITHWTWTEP